MWATIHGPEIRPYRITDQDVLWAARMAVFEGARAEDTLWTLTQRFVRLRSGSLTSLIRAFSQPLNPLWAPDGACCCGSGVCPSGGPYCGLPACSEDRFVKRARASSITMSELKRSSPATVAKVEAWASARLSNPVPKAIDFATVDVVTGKKAFHPDWRTVARRGGHEYVSDQVSRGWARDAVFLELDGRIAAASAGIGGVVFLAGAALLGYAYYRRTRR